ncbi:transcriptional regulator [Salegentibacter salinarum]|uniref:Transcriptional regulator n=1 Tax=Salegentibacter salinarum TaxID=447422 RepID=A0A2N0TSC8_9FLAO|nr:helix-turn-helix domain-containing protein [Salegentibacter salinarum]PKD17647.1 transcriptional regulator [Salegentibacter salinarum]SKB50302.1 Helix-turn-helix domain-containing protein [Salegentibacter salinarum]
MPTSIITTDDLQDFKMELLEDIKQLLNQQESGKIKKYLRSSEVMDYLQISPGTLQNLRINGTLPYTKIGGIIYYDAQEIQKVMEENRVLNLEL